MMSLSSLHTGLDVAVPLVLLVAISVGDKLVEGIATAGG